MRSERFYLADMVEALENVAEFIAGADLARFERDKLPVSAVIFQLFIVGEAASRMPATARERHPQVPWRRLAGFRNYVAHAYFGIDPKRIWDTATVEAPALRPAIAAILAAEFPDGT